MKAKKRHLDEYSEALADAMDVLNLERDRMHANKESREALGVQVAIRRLQQMIETHKVMFDLP